MIFGHLSIDHLVRNFVRLVKRPYQPMLVWIKRT